MIRSACSFGARYCLVSAIAATCAFLPGCIRPKGAGQLRSHAATASSNPFEPVRIEIHPLTTLRRNPETGRLLIEAHVSFFDAVDDEVKGRGLLLFELYLERAPAGERRQLSRWTVDLSDLIQNEHSYDRVTRTYRATLTGLPQEIERGDGGLTLEAQLTTADQRHLRAAYRLFRP